MCDCKTFTGRVASSDDYYDAEMVCSGCGVGKVFIKGNVVLKVDQNN